MKNLLFLLFLFPLFSISQNLPTYYTNLIEEEKYIDRNNQLERDIESLEYNIRNGNIDSNLLDFNLEIFSYYNNYGQISEEMYFKYLEESEYGDGWSYGFTDYVSSTLKSQGNNSYEKSNLGDRDPRTAWVEGSDEYGIGEYIQSVVGGEGVIYRFSILNGYQKSIKSWQDNSRVKSFKIYINNIPVCILELEDRMGEQTIPIDRILLEFKDEIEFEFEFEMRLEIFEVFPGERWKDVCISEIRIYSCYC